MEHTSSFFFVSFVLEVTNDHNMVLKKCVHLLLGSFTTVVEAYNKVTSFLYDFNAYINLCIRTSSTSLFSLSQVPYCCTSHWGGL